ncbi:OBERON-like protein isoform X2 [Amborella trichopoda]|uniref:OBERON-like protein isoform X2 n=1 Tax=Amborella trichopoda TaxID=13333 RepID=UPI0005D45571|nr:OBERON-like protein isoform X2 [Amborella trichopoda]|eukprot:XP_011625135.1 OBERON-like protein isoform X2 [Amborella trichopoda]
MLFSPPNCLDIYEPLYSNLPCLLRSCYWKSSIGLIQLNSVMGTSSNASFHQQQPPMPPPRQQSRESASSHETWPDENNRGEGTMENSGEHGKKALDKEKVIEEENNEPAVIRRVSSSDKITLLDVVREKIEIIAERMNSQSEELLESLKTELRTILEGTGGPQNREDIMILQKLVHGRTDLTANSLVRAHRVQLEILVAINTGIQAFLHPNVSLSQLCLIEIFSFKRCRNIACQNALPADDCSCEICRSRNGYCNLCMCTICSKFDFDVNTCRWIGCDVCAHWTHTDCAIRFGLISTGPGLKNGTGGSEMLFRCQACNRTSELLGWVKDVFQHCAPGWDRDALMRELDFVARIFRGSEDPRGRKLYWKCQDLLDRMKNGIVESTSCKSLLLFFQELEMESAKKPGGSAASDGTDDVSAAATGSTGPTMAPGEACRRIAEVVGEAVRKMEAVGEEKSRALKRARSSVEVCERELADKEREASELRSERQRQRRQVEELEAIVRLKQAEADMFRVKAGEARREAERLRQVASASIRGPSSEGERGPREEESAEGYLRMRLTEAEAEKRYIMERMRLQENGSSSLRLLMNNSVSESGAQQQQQQHQQQQQMLMLCKIQDLLKNVYGGAASGSKVEGQQQGSVAETAPPSSSFGNNTMKGM